MASRSIINSCKRSDFFKRNEVGAATLAIAVLIFLVLSSMLIASQTLTSSVVRDASQSEQRVQALFLAESGIERASQTYASNGICDSTQNKSYQMPGSGSFSLTFLGATNFTGGACTSSGQCCRIRSSGTAYGGSGVQTKNSRAVEAVLSQNTYVDNKGNRHFVITNTVTAGTNQFFALSILWSTNTAVPAQQVTGVKYNNALNPDMQTKFSIYTDALPAVISPGYTTVATQNKKTTYSGAYIQIFYLTNPPVGTNTVDIAFKGDALPTGIAFGGINANNVDPVNPLISWNSVSGTGIEAKILTVTVPKYGILFDALSRDGVGGATGPTCSPLPKTALYSGNANNVRGETWYCGPASTSTTLSSVGYTFSQAGYGYGLIVVNSTDTSGGGAKVRLLSSKATMWREVVMTGP